MKKNDDYIKRAAAVVPSERQLKWHELEFYAFIHFGMNTFTNSEWGNGNDDPVLFNPEKLNANQWAAAVRAAGMKAIILTCKHHDGFCLWPSEYTDYSVKKSKWKDGQGDVVRECAEACKKFGLKFGVYLSPWDRHDPRYGEGEAYNKYFKNQLRELLTNYGDIFCVWFDGACGEGKNGRKQEYDWQGYYDLIRECQPEAECRAVLLQQSGADSCRVSADRGEAAEEDKCYHARPRQPQGDKERLEAYLVSRRGRCLDKKRLVLSSQRGL